MPDLFITRRGGAASAAGKFSKIQILYVTASGTVNLPAGTVEMDFAMVGGAAGGISTTVVGIGAGNGVQRVRNVPVTTLALPVTIGSGGAANGGSGGNTVFQGVTAPGASGTQGVSDELTGVLLWDTHGLGVGGSGRTTSSSTAALADVRYGGAIYSSTSGQTTPPGMGGGGAGQSVSRVGGSGYLEIICKIKE